MPTSDGNGTHFDLTMGSDRNKLREELKKKRDDELDAIRDWVEAYPFEHPDMDPHVADGMRMYNYCRILIQTIKELDAKLESTEWHLANEATLHASAAIRADTLESELRFERALGDIE